MAHTKRFSNISNRGNKNRLSDRDMLLDLLASEKQMSHMYDHGITEASTPSVINTFEQLQHEEHDNAHTLFQAMQDRGWYNPSASNAQRRGSRYGNRNSATSNYAVTSGAQNFGNQLESGARFNRRSGRNTGGYTDYSHYQDWQ